MSERYATPFGWRVRWTKSARRGEWGFGFGRSLWPRPVPRGMAMYVVHILWWNLIVEIQ